MFVRYRAAPRTHSPGHLLSFTADRFSASLIAAIAGVPAIE